MGGSRRGSQASGGGGGVDAESDDGIPAFATAELESVRRQAAAAQQRPALQSRAGPVRRRIWSDERQNRFILARAHAPRQGLEAGV